MSSSRVGQAWRLGSEVYVAMPDTESCSSLRYRQGQVALASGNISNNAQVLVVLSQIGREEPVKCQECGHMLLHTMDSL